MDLKFTTKYFTKEITILIFLTCSIIQIESQNSKFWCSPQEDLSGGPSMPDMPLLFSTNIQVNYKSHGYTAELIRKHDVARKKKYLEVQAGTRHVLYLTFAEENAFLNITYTPEGPICKMYSLSEINKRSRYDNEDVGPFNILQLVEEKILGSKQEFAEQPSRDFIRGIPVFSWKACTYLPDLKTAAEITVYLSDEKWIPAHPVYTHIGPESKNEIVRIQVIAKGVKADNDELELIADFYNYEALVLANDAFAIPRFAHCPGYQGPKKEPLKLPNYFSYQSEILKHTTASGTKPIISHRAVYYDFDSELARVDIQKPKEEDQMYKFDTNVQSSIFDFKAGLQYTFETVFGTCSVNPLEATLDVFDDNSKKSSTLSMLKPLEFFYLDSATSKDPLSYKGRYETRGLPADHYSARIRKDGKNQNFFWYFTPDQDKDAEGNKVVAPKALLKMIIRPETGSVGKEDQIDINFYNFANDVQSLSIFDISMCYNESLSKEFVITFPGHVSYTENLYLTTLRLQNTVQEIAGISRQRVSVQEISFRDPFLLVRIKLLDLPPINGKKPVPNESNLEKAEELLRKSIANGVFKIEITTKKNSIIVLHPEKDGIKEFKGEHRDPPVEVFKESSFVGMSIGMTVLGFLLGATVVNLIMTKKYGVSLLQKSSNSKFNHSRFNDPLNESSI